LRYCGPIYIISYLLFGINSLSFAGNNTKKAELVVEYGKKEKVIHSAHALERRFPASLTKVMTLYVLFKAISEKKVNFNTKYKVSKYAAIQSPSKLGLKVGEKVQVLDLIKALIVRSANDAAVVIAEGLCGSVSKFCALMNRTAMKLGMKRTHFENPSGLPDPRQVTCAKDIVTLGMALYRDFPQHWHLLSLKSFKYRGKVYNSHCKILRWYRGSDGGKTGFTNASGYNLLVTAEKFNRLGKAKRVFVAVFGGNSSKSRDLYAAQLLNNSFLGYGNCRTLKSKNIPSVNHKKKSLSKQIDDAEDSIVEVDSVPLSVLLDELYAEDEEAEDVIQVVDEVIIK
jgi:D-alanyl-D-alanine carboxypeptidase